MNLLRLYCFRRIAECDINKSHFGVIEVVLFGDDGYDLPVDVGINHTDGLAFEILDTVNRAGQGDDQHHGVCHDQHGACCRHAWGIRPRDRKIRFAGHERFDRLQSVSLIDDLQPHR